MATTLERRLTRRFKICIPLLFHGPRLSWETAQAANSIDISMRGVCFTTKVAPFVGERVQVLLRMPKRILRMGALRYCFTGRVTHVEASGSSPEFSRVGVHFLYYEADRTPSSATA